MLLTRIEAMERSLMSKSGGGSRRGSLTITTDLPPISRPKREEPTALVKLDDTVEPAKEQHQPDSAGKRSTFRRLLSMRSMSSDDGGGSSRRRGSTDRGDGGNLETEIQAAR